MIATSGFDSIFIARPFLHRRREKSRKRVIHE
jgi:hypothetical protein